VRRARRDQRQPCRGEGRKSLGHSDEFRKQNKRWPNENDMLRLTPDKGTFQVFKPK
jgi:hypothetical protein